MSNDVNSETIPGIQTANYRRIWAWRCLQFSAFGQRRRRTTSARVADHAAGNYRVLMNLADELLSIAADRDLPRLDEKLFLDGFAQPPKAKVAGAQARKR